MEWHRATEKLQTDHFVLSYGKPDDQRSPVKWFTIHFTAVPCCGCFIGTAITQQLMFCI